MGDNVYDLFSGRRISDLYSPDTEANDRNAIGHGRYVGVLPKGTAKVVLGHIETLGRKKAQIDEMLKEFSTLYEGYSFTLGGALALLGVPLEEYDPEAHNLYVDSDGHCWIMAYPDDPAGTGRGEQP